MIVEASGWIVVQCSAVWCMYIVCVVQGGSNHKTQCFVLAGGTTVPSPAEKFERY